MVQFRNARPCISNWTDGQVYNKEMRITLIYLGCSLGRIKRSSEIVRCIAGKVEEEGPIDLERVYATSPLKAIDVESRRKKKGANSSAYKQLYLLVSCILSSSQPLDQRRLSAKLGCEVGKLSRRAREIFGFCLQIRNQAVAAATGPLAQPSFTSCRRLPVSVGRSIFRSASGCLRHASHLRKTPWERG
jgi:hypothetical protein